MFNEKKKDDYYFSSFVKQIQFTEKLADRTNEIMKDFHPEEIEHHLTELHQIEHQADAVQHEITEKLIKEFLPPIEREDIVSLAQFLDNLTDEVEDIIVTLYEYNIIEIHKPAIDFMDLICTGVRSTRKMLEAFSDFKKNNELLKHTQEINQLEEDADVLYRTTLRQLFTEEENAKTLIVWKEMYKRLEMIMDEMKDLANAVEAIAMKNA